MFIGCCRADLAAFLGLDEKLYKDNLEKMLESLPSDNDWDENDPYEKLMKMGDMKRYVFGHLKSTKVATEDADVVTEKATTSTSSLQVKAPLSLADGDLPLVMVKTEFPEKPKVAEILPVLASGRVKLAKQIEGLKAAHAKLKLCKRPEGPTKAQECKNMLTSLNNLDETLLILHAGGELLEVAEEAAKWLTQAAEARDVTTNSIDAAKLAVKRFQGYLEN